METIETLDSTNRIQIMTNRRNSSGPVFASHNYTFDDADRRETATREDATYWDYEYTERGQVTAARKKLTSDNTLLAGMESTYAYDDIGNRETWASGGGPATASGTPTPVSRTVTYTSNDLNQYTGLAYDTRSFDVIGRAPTSETVTVNTVSPYEQVITASVLDQFRASITAASGTNSTGGYEYVNVQTAFATNLEYSGLKWVPPTTTSPTYDHDGNLKTNGRWNYYWDAENRLVLASRAANTAAGLPALIVTFTYDAYSRRTEKVVSTYVNTSTSSGVTTEVLRERYLYDGWNPIGAWRWTVPASQTTPVWSLHQTYIWGPDVSGSAQGAGGVGGLLMILDASQTNGGWFPCYDGNGNIMALVDAVASGTATAVYDYDAFGNPVRMSGTAAKLNPFRFSTKFTDDETELVYYGYRYYDPVMGRWLNRDPIGERGGENINAFVSNRPTLRMDYLGMVPHFVPIPGQPISDPIPPPCCVAPGVWEQWNQITQCCLKRRDGDYSVVREKWTDDAGRKCCGPDMRFISLRLDTSDYIGHTFLSFSDKTAIGHYPKGGIDSVTFGGVITKKTIPGETGDDAKHIYQSQISYKVCPETERKLKQAANAHPSDPWNVYNAYGDRNCVGWALARLRDAGLTPPIGAEMPNLRPHTLVP